MSDTSFEKLQALFEQFMTVFEEAKAERDAEQTVNQETSAEATYGLEVYFMDVGQGDAALIKCGSAAMLIDAGNNTKGTKVRKFIKDHGIEKLDYIVGTHPGADHIGGLDSVLYNMPCDRLFLSDKAPAEAMMTASYQDVLAVANSKGILPEMPVLNQNYPLGEAHFTVLSPALAFTDSNDASLVIRLTFGKTSFLFTGDATKKAEAVMMASGTELKSNVLKIGHHGSSEATSEAFLEAVSPSAAIISCGEGNAYGHPAEDVLQRLQKKGVKTFRTDQQGAITVVSDGSRILWKTEKTVTVEEKAVAVDEKRVQIAPNTEESKAQVVVAENEVQTAQNTNEGYCSYIVNMSSYVFHRPGRHHLKQAARRNLAPVNFNHARCVAQNYVPCISCMP